MGGNFYCPKISIKETFQVMNIDISVIIVNYNTNDYLSGCISSILSSSFSGDLEVIVVDNNSLDDSIENLFKNTTKYDIKSDNIESIKNKLSQLKNLTILEETDKKLTIDSKLNLSELLKNFSESDNLYSINKKLDIQDLFS